MKPGFMRSTRCGQTASTPLRPGISDTGIHEHTFETWVLNWPPMRSASRTPSPVLPGATGVGWWAPPATAG